MWWDFAQALATVQTVTTACEATLATIQLVFQNLLAPCTEKEALHVLWAMVCSHHCRLGLMDSLVTVKMGAHRETPTALSTSVRPLSSVHPLVPLQVRALDEPLATVTTREGALASVDALVLCQVGAAAEAFATGAARVRPLP